MEITTYIIIRIVLAILFIITSAALIVHMRRKAGLNKFTEGITLIVPKGTKEKLKGYALIKGYKNENEYIAALINEQIKKDSEKLI